MSRNQKKKAKQTSYGWPEYEKIINVWADAASVKQLGCDIAAWINNILFYTSTAINSLKQFLNIDSLEHVLEMLMRQNAKNSFTSWKQIFPAD